MLQFVDCVAAIGASRQTTIVFQQIPTYLAIFSKMLWRNKKVNF